MMKFSTIALSAIAFAAGLASAQAQQGQMMGQQGSGMMQGQSEQQDTQSPANRPEGAMMPGSGRGMDPSMMQGDCRPGGMGYGRGGGMMMGPGMMMGSGMMMGGGMMMPQMMIIMMDTNGDGNLSLEEFQAVHERMFRHLDENGDGQLATDELGGKHGGDAR